MQTEAIPITLNLTGQQTFRTGHARPTATALENGGTIGAGEIPTVIRADELLFDPVKVTGLVCACVRGVPVDAFGPGISASGSIGCGDSGLTNIDYRMVQDHNTTPGSPGNSHMGTPDDPECNDTTEVPGGGTSSACLEGTGDKCKTAEQHAHRRLQRPARRDPVRRHGPEGLGTRSSTAPRSACCPDAGACDLDKPMRERQVPLPGLRPGLHAVHGRRPREGQSRDQPDHQRVG